MNSMTSNAYSYSIRITSCPSCAAPMEVPPGGGNITCPYCGSAVQITARDESATQILSSLKGGDITEEERLRRLRAQDGRPKQLPQELLPLIRNGTIPAWKQDEADAMWKLLIGKLRRSAELPVAEQLLTLTLRLAEQMDIQSAAQKRRALLESALEVDPLPRHRQVLLCRLAQDAIAVGDLDAASHWLNLCDPRADDLTADSYFRVSQALHSTKSQKHDEVLEALGADNDRVPILDELEDLACLLRCNACEKSGHEESAVELLYRRIVKTGFAAARHRFKKHMDLYESMNLCSKSLRQAFEKYGEERIKETDRDTIIIVCMLALLGPIGLYMGLVIFVFVGIPAAAILMYFGFSHRNIAKTDARVAIDGLMGTAELVEVFKDINKIEARVSVNVPGEAAYPAQIEIDSIKDQEPPTAGDVVPVLVDPENRSRVFFAG